MDKKLKSATSLLGRDDGEQVEHLSLRDLVPFQDHPFQIIECDEMDELIHSIANQGVATPIIVRPKGRGQYEIISGHRRKYACERLELPTIPAFIRDLDDDEATLFMVDTNIQRQTLLHSEKAFAYRMKVEALKRKAGRPKKNSVPVGHNFSGEENKVPVGHHLSAREELAKTSADSSVQIQRYIRLTYLSPDLLDLVDRKKLPFQTGVELSYLLDEEQEWVEQIMSEHGLTPTLAQAILLKAHSKEEDLTEPLARSILVKPKSRKKLTLKSDVSQFFPENTHPDQMEEVILMLLQNWSTQNP